MSFLSMVIYLVAFAFANPLKPTAPDRRGGEPPAGDVRAARADEESCGVAQKKTKVI